MSDMFEYLEAVAAEENLPFKNAASIAIDRSERRFGSFVSSAKGDKEFNSRLALVSNEILKIATDTCEEYGYDDPQHIAKLVIGQIQLLAEKTDNIGKAKREELPTQDPSGYYTEPSPKLNPGSAGDNMKNTNPAIPELTPDDSQHPSDKEWPWDSEIPRTGDGLTQVDPDKPMQPEFNVGDHTMTFPNKGQADPVTSKTAYYIDDAWTSDEDIDDIVDQKQTEKGRALQGLTDYALDSDIASEEDEELLPDGGMGNQNRDRTQGDPDIDDIHSDKDLNSQRWKSEHDRQNWKNYRDQQYKPAMAKAAAERMDFNSLSEIMTPSEAVGHLVEAGMPSHEAKDRIDFYVNHVNPAWASKNWTSSAEKKSIWDTNDPMMTEMSHQVETPSVESIGLLYNQYANSDQFETPQDLINALFSMYAENASPEEADNIAQMFDEAIGRGPSNLEEVKQNAMRFANAKTADHPGPSRDTAKMIEQVLQRGVGRGGNPLTSQERAKLNRELDIARKAETSSDYFTPGMNIDLNKERRIKKEMPDVVPDTLDDVENPATRSSPTSDLPVKYKMTSSVYSAFLKKQKKK